MPKAKIVVNEKNTAGTDTRSSIPQARNLPKETNKDDQQEQNDKLHN